MFVWDCQLRGPIALQLLYATAGVQIKEGQDRVLHLYPGVGHAPQIEIPDQFQEDLIRFLRSDADEPASEWK